MQYVYSYTCGELMNDSCMTSMVHYMGRFSSMSDLVYIAYLTFLTVPLATSSVKTSFEWKAKIDLIKSRNKRNSITKSNKSM